MSALDSTIDFMLTILAAYAEEKSHQISTNTKWPIMKKELNHLKDVRDGANLLWKQC